MISNKILTRHQPFRCNLNVCDYYGNRSMSMGIPIIGFAPLIFTNSVNNGNNLRHGSTFAREARFLKKIYTGSNKKKWFKPSDNATTSQLKEMELLRSSSNSNKSSSNAYAGLSRRAGVLNTVFLEHITGLLATGEVGYELIGKKIEFTKVKLSPTLSHIHIYWVSTESEISKEIEEIFKKIAPKLRFECSKVRLIGAIPPIVFVKDTELSKVTEVENILTDLRLKGEFDLNPLESPIVAVAPVETPNSKAGISSELHKELECLENPEYVSESDKFKMQYKSPGDMRQNILGLNHARIMEGIIQAKLRMATKKSSATANNSLQSKILETPDDDPRHDFDNGPKQKERQIQFLDYLKKRRIEKDKISKRETTSAFNRAFDEEERYERGLLNMKLKVMEVLGDDDNFENEFDDDDYFEEEEEATR